VTDADLEAEGRRRGLRSWQSRQRPPVLSKEAEYLLVVHGPSGLRSLVREGVRREPPGLWRSMAKCYLFRKWLRSGP
jgi:hypothetical protein